MLQFFKKLVWKINCIWQFSTKWLLLNTVFNNLYIQATSEVAESATLNFLNALDLQNTYMIACLQDVLYFFRVYRDRKYAWCIYGDC